ALGLTGAQDTAVRDVVVDKDGSPTSASSRRQLRSGHVPAVAEPHPREPPHGRRPITAVPLPAPPSS
ncbi:hypothetical protein AB0P40_41650, partial [Streptomyces sp. NPDC079189]|uniref:hypothetical protein n=1 Tax=Streptomyces sp. NPDC079189 TaxID=3154514 RepID=UPI00341E57E7